MLGGSYAANQSVEMGVLFFFCFFLNVFFLTKEPAVDASFLRFKYLYLSLSFFLAGASGSGRGPGRYLILCTLFRCLLMVLGRPCVRILCMLLVLLFLVVWSYFNNNVYFVKKGLKMSPDCQN